MKKLIWIIPLFLFCVLISANEVKGEWYNLTSYMESDTTGVLGIEADTTAHRYSQSFSITGGAGTTVAHGVSIKWDISSGGFEGDETVHIRIETDSAGDRSGTLADVDCYVNVSYSDLSASLWQNFTFEGGGDCTLTNGTTYHLAPYYNSVIVAGEWMKFRRNSAGGYASGMLRRSLDGAGWTDDGDMMFIVFSNITAGDTEAPTFNETPANKTLRYSLDTLYVDYNATDDTAIDTWYVNDTTKFNITQTGELKNKTLTGTGTHYVTVSVNDTSNNINSTYFQVIITSLSLGNETINFTGLGVQEVYRNISVPLGEFATKFTLNFTANYTDYFCYIENADDTTSSRCAYFPTEGDYQPDDDWAGDETDMYDGSWASSANDAHDDGRAAHMDIIWKKPQGVDCTDSKYIWKDDCNTETKDLESDHCSWSSTRIETYILAEEEGAIDEITMFIENGGGLEEEDYCPVDIFYEEAMNWSIWSRYAQTIKLSKVGDDIGDKWNSQDGQYQLISIKDAINEINIDDACVCTKCVIEGSVCYIPLKFETDVPATQSNQFFWEIYENSTATLGLDNCSTYTTYALNFTFLNASTNATMNVSFEAHFEYEHSVLNDTYSFSTTDDYWDMCILPSYTNFTVDFTIDYGNALTYTYTENDLFISNQSQQIYIYVSSNDDIVTFNVVDSNDDDVSGVIISVLEWDVGSGTFQLVSQLETNSIGEVIGYVTFDTVWYAFILTYEGSVILDTTTVPTKLTSSTYNFQVNLEDDFYNEMMTPLGIYALLTFNNESKYFTCTWMDIPGIVERTCVKAEKYTLNGITFINQTCSTDSTGSAIARIGDSVNESTYMGTCFITLPGSSVDEILRTLSVSFRESWRAVYGLEGVFVSFIIILTLTMVGIWSIPVAIALMVIGFFMMNVIGFIYIAPTLLVGLICLGVITIIKVTKGGFA